MSNITDAQDDLARALRWAKALDPDLTPEAAATLAAAAVLTAELTSLRGAYLNGGQW